MLSEPFGVIYLVTNRVTGMYYVGQTIKRLSIRWAQHCCNAKAGSRFHFHRAVYKYGRDNFDVEVLSVASSMDELNHLESLWILVTGSYLPTVGYNRTMGGGNRFATPETRKRMSESHKGHFVSPEARALMSEIKKAQGPNPKAIAAMREANIGNQWNVGKKDSAETRDRKSASMRGIPKSPEHVAKMSARSLGNTNWLGKTHSPETRKLLSEQRLGRKATEEQRHNQSIAKRGIPWSAARQEAERLRKERLTSL